MEMLADPRWLVGCPNGRVAYKYLALRGLLASLAVVWARRSRGRVMQGVWGNASVKAGEAASVQCRC